MPRFIVRYLGKGERPELAVTKIRALEGVSIVDDSGPMLLVDAPEQALRAAVGTDADWMITPEVHYTVPDTRKKVKGPPER